MITQRKGVCRYDGLVCDCISCKHHGVRARARECWQQVKGNGRLIVGQVELMLLLAVREKGEKKGKNRRAGGGSCVRAVSSVMGPPHAPLRNK